MGRPVPATNTDDGIRAVRGRNPIDPDRVRRYPGDKFSDDLKAVGSAMQKLAKAYTPQELAHDAYRLSAAQNGRDARTVYSAYPPDAGLASAVPVPDEPGVGHGSRRVHPEAQAGGEHIHDFQREAAVLK